ncbi:MAG: hypothetical protein HY081_08550 [Gammaproteobacteria bacterium]|nr:hypothetical protein [Gammaproteobacteria bacterium]
MIFRKTIFVLALPLSLSLPVSAADGVSAPASLYIGTATVSATKQDAAKDKDAAALAEDRGADTNDTASSDCFYQQNANNPDCVKSPQAKAPSETSSAPGGY